MTDFTKRTVVYELPGMAEASVRRDVEYRASESGARTFDVYLPAGATRPLPAVVFVSGYPGLIVERVLGGKSKDLPPFTSWGRLVAAAGLAAVLYTNHEPLADLDALLAHLRTHGATLGIDPDRVAVWACSGNVPAALSLLVREAPVGIRCAALLYGYMLDFAGTTTVAEAAQQFGFVANAASVADLPADLPLIVVRAGRDEMPGLTNTIDRFIAAAIDRNLPVTVVNHASAPHAFDLVDPGPASRAAISQLLTFLQSHLIPAG